MSFDNWVFKCKKNENISDKGIVVIDFDGNRAVHQWFVDNVQDGDDDCGYYPIDRDIISDICDEIYLTKDEEAKQVYENLVGLSNLMCISTQHKYYYSSSW